MTELLIPYDFSDTTGRPDDFQLKDTGILLGKDNKELGRVVKINICSEITKDCSAAKFKQRLTKQVIPRGETKWT